MLRSFHGGFKSCGSVASKAPRGLPTSRDRIPPAARRRRGVTLLEVVLSMGILIFLSSMTYWFYSSSLESSRHGTAAAQRLRMVRVILDRMAREIRQAAVMTTNDKVGLVGDAEQIWVTTYRVPTREQSRERRTREDPAPPEYDVVTVEYKIVRHPEIQHEDNYDLPLGLARIERLFPRPLPRLTDEELAEEDGLYGDGEDAEEGDEFPEAGDEAKDDEAFADAIEEAFLKGEEAEEMGDPSIGLDIRWDELYSPEIRYLRLCYYDGNRWWDSWDITGENPLPQLVRVTIGFSPVMPFGEGFGEEEPNEEFCTCLNEDPVDCEPLPEDQYSVTVRTAHADPLFRSRVSREAQNLVEELSPGAEEAEQESEE